MNMQDEFRIIIDEKDRQILNELMRNGRVSSQRIAEAIRIRGITLTPRAIRKRIQGMEKRGIILNYSTIIDPQKVSPQERRLILITLKASEKFGERVSELRDYFKSSLGCTFSARLSGDIDWISCMLFPRRNDGQMECDRIRTLFSDIIQDLRSYEVDVVKAS